MAKAATQEGELVICHPLHQVAIMGHQDERPRPTVQHVLHRSQHVYVQVIARLIQDENVGLLQQDHHEGESSLLTS